MLIEYIDLEKECYEMKEKAHQPQRAMEVTRHLQTMSTFQQEEKELKQSIQTSQENLASLTQQMDSLQRELEHLERQEQEENETPPNAEM